ncbi:MAG: iron(III) transport system substrate-binding protein, partial [Mycobacterium sp.]|nr:iron(III) transport system substrate-binding protein [Mycobacterium sp.]
MTELRSGRRLLGAAVAASMLLVLAACGGTAGGATDGSDTTIVYYTTRPEDGLPALKAAFESANPGYTLDVIRASSSDTVAKLLTEAQAGQQKADLTELNALPMAELSDAGVLAPLPASVVDPLPEQAKAPDGTYAGTRYFGHLTPFNTDLVPPEHQPKSYEDFLDPYWKGNFVVGANDVEWAYQVYASKGEAAGHAFLEQIAAQQPQIRDEGRGALTELIAIGQLKAS